MTTANQAPVLALSCGPPPEGWWEQLQAEATAHQLHPIRVTLAPAPRLDQAVATLAAQPTPAVILAPRGSQVGGGICALTLARLATSLPALEWNPSSLHEALDTAHRIIQLSQPALPVSTHEPINEPPAPPKSHPPQEKSTPSYIRQRTIRLGPSDLESTVAYEDQLRTRARPAPEPLPPAPLPLSQALQSGLARAGARVLSSEDNSAAIHPAHVLLSLLERAEGGLAAAVMAAGKSPRDLVHALAQALGLEPWTEDQIPPRFRSGRVPDENLRQLLEQTRREGRSRGAPVATTRDFLRSILAQDHPVRDALATVGLNLQVLRDLLDEHHYPDQEELEIEEETQEPVAQPGWPDPLAGLDPQTREELLQAMKHEQEGLTPPPQKLPAIPPRPTGNPESYRRDPRAPARDNRHPRRLILTNPEIPTVDLVDATADQLAAGRIVVFPSDCGIHALVRLGDEQAAAQLLKFRRGLDFATSEILIHNLRAAGAFPDSHNITQHQGLLDNLGDYRVAVRLLWNTRHSAIDILDETPKTGWHLGWRIPAHTALLAVLATLNQPVLALRARSIDPAMEALLAHDSQPVSLAVHPRTIPLPITPAVLDLRSRVPRIESPGDPPEEVSTIRRLLGSIPP